MNITTGKNPVNSVKSVIDSNGPKKVNSQRAIYAVTLPTNRNINVAIVVLKHDKRKEFWVGREHAFYVSTKRGIIGLTSIYGGVEWSKAIWTGGFKDFASISDVWQAVDRHVTSEQLLLLSPRLDFEPALGEAFFRRDPTSMAPGTPHINSLTVKDNKVIVDISSPNESFEATAVFDASDMKMEKCSVVKQQKQNQ